METINEEVASRMSKHQKFGLWIEANRRAIEVLCDVGIKCGVFILWGLGESQLEREHHLEQLISWQKHYKGQPCAIGLNWATLHPAGSSDESPSQWNWNSLRPDRAESRPLPDFLRWGTSEQSPRLGAFVEMFGETSEEYPYYFGTVLSTADIAKIRPLYLQLYSQDSAS
jgi:hypothetical protein